MSACCPADVERIISVNGTTVTETYLDHRTTPSTIIDAATYAALTLVKCPETAVDMENICIQTTGNTDASLIEEGFRCVNKTITYDAAGAATVAITGVTLHQADGTDVTATHEQVSCPEPIVTSVKSCVAP